MMRERYPGVVKEIAPALHAIIHKLAGPGRIKVEKEPGVRRLGALLATR